MKTIAECPDGMKIGIFFYCVDCNQFIIRDSDVRQTNAEEEGISHKIANPTHKIWLVWMDKQWYTYKDLIAQLFLTDTNPKW